MRDVAGFAGYRVLRHDVFIGQSFRLNKRKPDDKTAQALADGAGG